MLVTESPGFDYLGGCTSLPLCITFDLTSCLFINYICNCGWKVWSLPRSGYDWLSLAHQPAHHEQEARQSLSLKHPSKTQIAMCCSLIPEPIAKCQCGCSRFYGLAEDGWQQKAGRKTEASWELPPLEWRVDWPSFKGRPWRRLFSEAQTGGLNSLSHQFRSCWFCQGGWGH